MAKQKPAWLSFLPPGVSLSKLSLDDVRAVKDAHALLTERVEGPECFVDCTRGFRLLLLFGIDCVAENKYPPLTRCWNELERLFMGDPGFEDGVFVQSWILMDFPFGPQGQTALDYFEDFLTGTPGATELQRFIDAARGSRLGLHQDIMRTKSVARFRELLSGKVTSAVPTVDDYETGEICWPAS